MNEYDRGWTAKIYSSSLMATMGEIIRALKEGSFAQETAISVAFCNYGRHMKRTC